MYYKGSWMLHSIRNTINNDSLWYTIIRDIAQEFALQNIDGDELINFMSQKSLLDLKPIFEQFLGYANLPMLSYKLKKRNGKLILRYKWTAHVDDFNMPIEVSIGTKTKFRIFPTSKYKTLDLGKATKNEVRFTENLFLYEKKED